MERLGSVRLAAQELGFNPVTCAVWASRAGRTPGGKRGQAEKGEFFAVLDRVQSVSVAARELRINVQTAFHWAHKTGAVTRKPRKVSGPSQRTSQAEKAEFLTVLKRVGSVSTAARELGLDQRMCIGWARRAGIASVHPGVWKREEFLRLRRAGVGRKEAATTASASRKSAYLWDNGLVQVNGRAVRPDTGDPANKREMTTDFVPLSGPGAAPEVPAAAAKPASPTVALAPTG